MAYLVKISILIDAISVDDAENIVANTIKNSSDSVFQDAYIDVEINSVDMAVEELNDSIANETYERGDAFKDWVVFSASETLNNRDGEGFWSNTYGWTTLDLATKFDAIHRYPPHTACTDAVWMIAPTGMRFYQVMLQETPNETENLDAQLAFNCWAEDEDHAIEQAVNAYPESKFIKAKQI